LDQRLEDRIVDLPQSHHAQAGAKRVEEANVGHSMAMAQPGERTPGALFWQQVHQQIERMHGSQQRQQMHAPELGGAELPARATVRTPVPAFVDEVVRNVWIQQVEQMAATGQRKAVHGARAYPY
jgi:hypothetical protein